MSRTATTIIVFAALAIVAHPVQGQPVVDGQFEDWGAMTVIATDPFGDAGGTFDITEVHAASSGSRLYVHFDTNTLLNLQSGSQDDGTLRLEIGFQGDQRLTIDFRERVAYTGGNPNNFMPWSELGFVSLNTYADDRFELSIDIASLGFGFDDTLTLNFSGSDALEKPVPFTLETPAQPPLHRPTGRDPCTTLRLADLNTLFGGLLDPQRQAAIGRLVQAAAADVYCFQEQNSPESQISSRLAELDPLGNQAEWNVHRSNDTVIASHKPLIAVPRDGDAAAVVDFGAHGAVVVFSIHPPCCGYIGTNQDQARIAEMEGVISTIQDLRGAQLGPALQPYRYAPIIIVGDWNLVGSSTPLDLLLDPQGPKMTHWRLPHVVGDDVITWRDLNENPGDFPPGLLDLLTFSADLLSQRNGFVLNSAELGAGELAALGLQADDSQASDHLMVVADFATMASGDFNGDEQVDAADLGILLGNWGDCAPCAADLTGDGRINASDLAQFLGVWGPCDG